MRIGSKTLSEIQLKPGQSLEIPRDANYGKLETIDGSYKSGKLLNLGLNHLLSMGKTHNPESELCQNSHHFKNRNDPKPD